AVGGVFAVVSTVAFAQPAAVRSAPAARLQVEVKAEPVARAAPRVVADEDLSQLRQAIAATRTGDVEAAKAAAATIKAPVARKIAEWALVDVRGEQLGFADVDAARRDLSGWPRDL